MTVFEYLQQLPQDLFEATLMGLMGVPMEEKAEGVFHEWMSKPYDEFFPSVEKISAMEKDQVLVELSKSIKKMSEEDKEMLRRSLIGYCEVCDGINQRLANKQKAVNGE